MNWPGLERRLASNHQSIKSNNNSRLERIGVRLRQFYNSDKLPQPSSKYVRGMEKLVRDQLPCREPIDLQLIVK